MKDFTNNIEYYIDQYDLERTIFDLGKEISNRGWLKRDEFLTIEILPTIAKIATPIGAYDRAIYRKEKDLELELEERTSEYLKQQKTLRDIENEAEQEQTKERTQIENNLHKELLTEIANVQNKIAREKIEEFKKKHNA